MIDRLDKHAFSDWLKKPDDIIDLTYFKCPFVLKKDGIQNG